MGQSATKLKAPPARGPIAPAIVGQCDLERRSFAIGISDITPDGCSATADAEWEDDAEFLHLNIAGRIDVNGRVESHKGRRATIRFFGQIHPCVVKELASAVG